MFTEDQIVLDIHFYPSEGLTLRVAEDKDGNQEVHRQVDGKWVMFPEGDPLRTEEVEKEIAATLRWAA